MLMSREQHAVRTPTAVAAVASSRQSGARAHPVLRKPSSALTYVAKCFVSVTPHAPAEVTAVKRRLSIHSRGGGTAAASHEAKVSVGSAERRAVHLLPPRQPPSTGPRQTADVVADDRGAPLVASEDETTGREERRAAARLPLRDWGELVSRLSVNGGPGSSVLNEDVETVAGGFRERLLGLQRALDRSRDSLVACGLAAAAPAPERSTAQISRLRGSTPRKAAAVTRGVAQSVEGSRPKASPTREEEVDHWHRQRHAGGGDFAEGIASCLLGKACGDEHGVTCDGTQEAPPNSTTSTTTMAHPPRHQWSFEQNPSLDDETRRWIQAALRPPAMTPRAAGAGAKPHVVATAIEDHLATAMRQRTVRLLTAFRNKEENETSPGNENRGEKLAEEWVAKVDATYGTATRIQGAQDVVSRFVDLDECESAPGNNYSNPSAPREAVLMSHTRGDAVRRAVEVECHSPLRVFLGPRSVNVTVDSASSYSEISASPSNRERPSMASTRRDRGGVDDGGGGGDSGRRRPLLPPPLPSSQQRQLQVWAMHWMDDGVM